MALRIKLSKQDDDLYWCVLVDGNGITKWISPVAMDFVNLLAVLDELGFHQSDIHDARLKAEPQMAANLSERLKKQPGYERWGHLLEPDEPD